jgi:hypothetical protein
MFEAKRDFETGGRIRLLSAYQEKIHARNVI